MKKTYKLSRRVVILCCGVACLAAILIYACKKPTEGINLIVNSNTLFPAPTVIKFTNADSTSANKPGDFPVTISGPGAKYVQMGSGGVNFQVSKGLLSLALTKDAHPSPSNPISFTVSASLPNFAPVLQNIVITEDKLSVYNVKAVEYASPAKGTTALTRTVALTSGILPNAFAVTTEVTPSMTEQATITFASGTQMRDINDITIAASTLNLNIVQYGTATNSSILALPGGTSTNNATHSDGSPIGGNVSFVIAGFLQLNFDAGGVAVKKFSKPVNLSIELNSKLTNFATGHPIQVGDVIPYWSLDETTGQWKNEGETSVVLNARGKLSASIPILHLSSWSIGWSWGTGGVYGSCDNKLTVNITTSDPNFRGGAYNVSLQTVDGTYLMGVQGLTISNGSVVNLTSLPNIPQAKIVVSGGIPYISIQSSPFAPCSAASVTMDVPVSADNTVNVAVNVVGLCKGKDLTILPSATFELYQETGSNYTDAGTLQLVNGKGTTGLQVGKMYYLTTTYNGVDYTTDKFSVSKADFAVPSSALTLNAKYDAASNTLNLTGSIPITCN